MSAGGRDLDDRIFAKPDELRRAAGVYKRAAGEYEAIARGLDASLPLMPPAVEAEVRRVFGEVRTACDGLAYDTRREGQYVGHTAALFERADRVGGLGEQLSDIDRDDALNVVIAADLAAQRIKNLPNATSMPPKTLEEWLEEAGPWMGAAHAALFPEELDIHRYRRTGRKRRKGRFRAPSSAAQRQQWVRRWLAYELRSLMRGGVGGAAGVGQALLTGEPVFVRGPFGVERVTKPTVPGLGPFGTVLRRGLPVAGAATDAYTGYQDQKAEDFYDPTLTNDDLRERAAGAGAARVGGALAAGAAGAAAGAVVGGPVGAGIGLVLGVGGAWLGGKAGDAAADAVLD